MCKLLMAENTIGPHWLLDFCARLLDASCRLQEHLTNTTCTVKVSSVLPDAVLVADGKTGHNLGLAVT
jgi:hypothetical protein